LDIDFKDALSVNGIGAPLISVSSLAEQGALIAFDQHGGTITVGEHCKLSFGSDHKLMCIVRKPVQNAAKTTAQSAASAPGVSTSAPSALPTSGSSDLSAKLYRARFNHVGIRLVAHTLKQTAAAEIKPQTFIESDVAKMKAIPFNGTRAPSTRAFTVFLCLFQPAESNLESLYVKCHNPLKLCSRRNLQSKDLMESFQPSE
jgi:hypothetical protein